jgi:hypothetical protein
MAEIAWTGRLLEALDRGSYAIEVGPQGTPSLEFGGLLYVGKQLLVRGLAGRFGDQGYQFVAFRLVLRFFRLLGRGFGFGRRRCFFLGFWRGFFLVGSYTKARRRRSTDLKTIFLFYIFLFFCFFLISVSR